MTPEMWLELEHTTHRYFLHFAAVRQISLGIQYGVAFVSARLSASGKWVPHPFLWSLRHGWVGWGAKIVSARLLTEACSFVLLAALKPLQRNLLLLGAHGMPGWWRARSMILLQAQGRPSLFVGIGAACRCWLGTWPHDPVPWGSMPLLV